MPKHKNVEALENMLKNFIRVANINKLFKSIMSDQRMKQFIIEKNQEQLYEDGIDSEGKELGYPGYSPTTIEIKKIKGQRYDHVTLKDSGDFYRSFKIHVFSDYIEIRVIDKSGNDSLIRRYGEDILGLDELNKTKLNQLIINDITQKIISEILP